MTINKNLQKIFPEYEKVVAINLGDEGICNLPQPNM